MRSCVSASELARRPVTTTFAPALAISTAAACPMPLPPPVTQAIFPASAIGGSVLRAADHDRLREPVVPALLALVPGDPDEDHQRHANQAHPHQQQRAY